MPVAADRSPVALRDALMQADLLGFSTRRGGAGAKAAFVGMSIYKELKYTQPAYTNTAGIRVSAQQVDALLTLSGTPNSDGSYTATAISGTFGALTITGLDAADGADQHIFISGTAPSIVDMYGLTFTTNGSPAGTGPTGPAADVNFYFYATGGVYNDNTNPFTVLSDVTLATPAPTVTNFVFSETAALGAAAMKVEPTVVVTDVQTGAHERYSVTTTGFMSGDQLNAPNSAVAGVTCGSNFHPSGGFDYVYSNDPTSPANASQIIGPGFSFTPTTTALSASDVSAFFESLTFASTSTTAHDVTVAFTVKDDYGSAPTQTLTIHVGAAAPNPVVAGGAANQPVNDNATVKPFAAVTVTETNAPTDPETVTVTLSNAANGTLGGGKFAATATAGVYTYTATSAADAQAALQGAVFTPTPNQVAPGGTVQTGFTIQVADGAATSATDTANSVTATSIDDAPTVTGTHTSVASDRGLDTLFSGVVVGDPDQPQTETATISFSAANGTLTGAGAATTLGGVATYTLSAASAGALTTALQGVAFTPTAQPAGTPATQTTVTLSVSDGAVSSVQNTGTVVTATHTTNTAPVLSNVPASAATAVPAAGTEVLAPSLTITDPDVGAMVTSATVAITTGFVTGDRLTVGALPAGVTAAYTAATGLLTLTGAATNTAYQQALQMVAFIHDGSIYAQVQGEQAIALNLDQGRISAQDAQTQLFHLVDGTTSVAEISYAFFTGRTPTQAGLNYLVHSAANTTDLNDPYYAKFTVENRYINFGVNLATGAGAGAAAFQANYGSLSLTDAMSKAYGAIFGVTPTADKITAILTEQVSNGLGGTETRAQYLADITGGTSIAQKAAVVGFLLADSVKEGFGAYQQADLHFLQDLAHGTAAFNLDLLAAYAQAPSLVGQPVVDPSLSG